MSKAEIDPPAAADQRPSQARSSQSRSSKFRPSLLYSLTILRSRKRNAYKNPLTGHEIKWEERKMDQKVD